MSSASVPKQVESGGGGVAMRSGRMTSGIVRIGLTTWPDVTKPSSTGSALLAFQRQVASQSWASLVAPVADTQHVAMTRLFAQRVRDAWPGSEVWMMCDPSDPSVTKVVIVAPHWDMALMSEVVDLSMDRAFVDAGLDLDASVYFADSERPRLEGYLRLD